MQTYDLASPKGTRTPGPRRQNGPDPAGGLSVCATARPAPTDKANTGQVVWLWEGKRSTSRPKICRQMYRQK